jgi:hypothetical protein
MSRAFNRYVERQFALRMKRFDLEPAKASGPVAWPGERCFRTKGNETGCWICIFPNYKGLNEFNVELAWSHRGEYPASCTARPTPRAEPPACFSSLAEGFLRLGNFTNPPRGAWSAGTLDEQLAMLEQAEVPSIADPLIENALRTIELVGMPLAAQAIAARSAFLRGAA